VEKFYKRILLGICGGIAAYKSAELVRLLRNKNIDVRVVMTNSAMQFMTPLTLQALSGNPVHTSLLDADQENSMGHINLVRWADAIVIAPATANIIAKFSHGLADDLLSTLLLAAECPVFIAPAMNQAMWKKPATQENIQRLDSHGIIVLGPDQGVQACGDTGPGRMLEPAAICSLLCTNNKDLLQGISILISAGPTREPLDPVRYISNRSSGKMGYALAKAALQAGADVTLVSGPVNQCPPKQANLIQVETAAEMFEVVMTHAPSHDIYIGAAAVADYTPATVQTEKIKKQGDISVLKLSKTQDIITAVAALTEKPFIVGFAAETHDLEKYARGKMEQKKLDMIAANWVGRKTGGFDSNENALQVFWTHGQCTIAMAEKNIVAAQLIKLIAEKYRA
jgi:phosphopantothenoylcysteine decarboxylase / phosphopantothenate---cysteine ligase